MYRVMIVDDEVHIRDGLKRIIEWEEYDTCIVAEAKNGVEALQKMKEERPDILIVDIQMPVMDGLALLEEIDRRGLPVQSVVLSGHEHFEYVRAAMRHGAVNYLLKPLESDELVLTLTEIVEGLRLQQERAAREGEALQQMRTNLLNRIIHDETTTVEFEEKMRYVGVELDFTDAFIAVLDDCGRQEKGHSERRRDICAQKLAGNADCIVFGDRHQRTVMLFKNSAVPPESMEQELRDLVRRIRDQSGADVMCSVGQRVPGYAQLHLSYAQAVECLDYMIIYGANQVVYHSRVLEAGLKSHTLPEVDARRLHDCFAAYDEEALRAYIQEIFGCIEESRSDLSPKEIRELAQGLIISIVAEVENASQTQNLYLDIYDEGLLEKVNTADAIDELHAIVERMACRTMSLHNINYQTSGAKLPRVILDHVLKHYNAPDICLKALAYEYGFSATHLGRLFKGATGQYFSDYLNGMRVQQAKHLLAHSSMKIKDISEACGYANAGYFYTIFKKVAGCNPSEYRNAQNLEPYVE